MIDVIESVVLLLLSVVVGGEVGVVCSRNGKRMIRIVRRCMMVMIMFVMTIVSLKMMAVARMMMP